MMYSAAEVMSFPGLRESPTEKPVPRLRAASGGELRSGECIEKLYRAYRG